MKKEDGRIGLIIGIIIAVVIAIVGVVIALFFVLNDTDYKIEEVSQYNYFKLYQDGKYGVIDRKSNTVINAEYDQLYIPNPSKDVFACYYDYSSQEGEYKIKILNSNNEELFTKYERVEPFVFKENISSIPFEKSVLKYKSNGKYGLISLEGKEITRAEYDSIECLLNKEGCFLVEKNGQTGVINMNGKTMVQIEYNSIKADGYYCETEKYKNEGFITSKRTDNGYRYGYIDAKGRKILENDYVEINRINEIDDEENIYLFAIKNGRAGILKNKDIIISFEYEDIEYNSTNKLFSVQKGNKIGVYNIDGKQVIPVEYDYVLISGDTINAKKGDEIFLLDKDGNKIDNTEYSTRIKTEDENCVIVANNDGMFGVVDKKGNTIIECEYQYVEYLTDEYFAVTNNGKVGIVDSKNNLVINNEYDIIQKVKGTNLLQALKTKEKTITIFNIKMEEIIKMESPVIYVEDDYVKIINENERVYTNKDGKKLESKDVSKFSEMYSVNKDGKWGFEGQVSIEAKYEMVTELNEYGFAGIKQGGKWGVIDNTGKIIVEPKYEISWKEPEFIGPYCRMNFGYGFEYYTNQI